MKECGYMPRLVAWELTRRCHFRCRYCRVGDAPPGGEELTIAQCFLVLEAIASAYRPVMIITGGDPFLREDIFAIARHGSDLGLTMVAASCGMGLDEKIALRIVESGIRRVSLSLDGARAESHDGFRGVPGAFDMVIEAITACGKADLEFQINTTVTKLNAGELREIVDLARRLGAKAFHPFFFVPTGTGRDATSLSLNEREYEIILRGLFEWGRESGFLIKPTCAPQYYRIAARLDPGAHPRRAGRGCMAGESFAFISSTGDVKPCGFLDLVAGNLIEADYDFQRVWTRSELFRELRDRSLYSGACATCDYQAVCGGCRARAYEVSGNFLGEEPFCAYGRSR